MRLLPLALNAPISLIFIVVILATCMITVIRCGIRSHFAPHCSAQKNISTEKIKSELDRLI
jgi:hypothetical protein